MDIDQDNNIVENRGEDDEENGEIILAGLNLVTILSLLSLSEEERSNFDEIQEMEIGNKAKHGVPNSSLQTKRQQVNQFPALARQTTRVQTKIRDSR